MAASASRDHKFELKLLLFEENDGVLAAVSTGLSKLHPTFRTSTWLASGMRTICEQDNPLAWQHVGWAVEAIEREVSQ